MIQGGTPGAAALMTLSATPPPIGDQPFPGPDKVSFRIRGSNFTVVRASRNSQLAFDVLDANGRKVGSYGTTMTAGQ